MTSSPIYCIAITYRDDEKNRLLTLGGAGCEICEEWDREWNAIPASLDDSSHCIADKIDENDDIVDDRYIDIETVEVLLGKPISQLIEEGRANLNQ